MKRTLALMGLLLLTFASFSQTVTVKKAASTGIAFLSEKSPSRSMFIISDTLKFEKNNTAVFYLFSFQEGGYVIVAANEAIGPVIGYSTDAPIDLGNLPENMAWWLAQQSTSLYDAIAQAQHSTNRRWSNLSNVPSKNGVKAVTPLCTTKWDQGCYYNTDCPSDTLGQCGHVAVGCVATAMAQVMKHWNYPLHGKDTHSYTTPYYGTLFANFGNATYNWVAMNDSLSAPNPAVAQLMSHCGIAADMQYGSTSSSSWIRPAPFTKYFKYSLNAVLLNAYNYDSLGWVNRLRQELDAGRPMVYAGMPEPPLPVGHAWVCDGYDATGFFHFNWGWSGWGDGYFQMNGFTFPLDNSAVANLMPIQNCDVLVKSLTAPVHQTFTAPAAITVRVANYDSLMHTNIPICYRIGNGPVVTDTITDTVNALGEALFTFSQLFDFSSIPGHDYQISVFTAFPCDAYRDNDTMRFSIKNVLCADPPYSMGFETNEEFAGWWLVDANADGNSWNIGSLGGHSAPWLAYASSGTQASNDWLISKCISLDTATLYKLSFWYKSTGQFWPQDFSVYMGPGNSLPQLSTLLTAHTNVISDTYQQSVTWFTVPSSGSYYFGWHNYTAADMLNLGIDDISIEPTNGLDVGITQAISPVTGCDLQTEEVTIVVRNFCSTALTNIPITYIMNGGAPVTEIIPGPINVGGSINFNFSIPASCAASGDYHFVFYTALSGDTLYGNDTLISTVTNHHSAVLPYSMGFEPTEDYSEWTIENVNEDVYTWSIVPTQGHLGPACARYDYSSWLPANDWIITKCLYLTTGITYRLRFEYKIEDAFWPESMAVYLGNAPVSTSLNTLIIDLPGLTNASWTPASPLFTVPSEGFYYIGWKCYSEALMFNLYLDDIYLEETTVDVSEQDPASFMVYPNPSDGQYYITDMRNTSGEKVIEVMDMMGSIILRKTETASTFELDLSMLPSGIYLARFKTDAASSSIRLIKR